MNECVQPSFPAGPCCRSLPTAALWNAVDLMDVPCVVAVVELHMAKVRHVRWGTLLKGSVYPPPPPPVFSCLVFNFSVHIFIIFGHSCIHCVTLWDKSTFLLFQVVSGQEFLRQVCIAVYDGDSAYPQFFQISRVPVEWLCSGLVINKKTLERQKERKRFSLSEDTHTDKSSEEADSRGWCVLQNSSSIFLTTFRHAAEDEDSLPSASQCAVGFCSAAIKTQTSVPASKGQKQLCYSPAAVSPKLEPSNPCSCPDSLGFTRLILMRWRRAVTLSRLDNVCQAGWRQSRISQTQEHMILNHRRHQLTR